MIPTKKQTLYLVFNAVVVLRGSLPIMALHIFPIPAADSAIEFPPLHLLSRHPVVALRHGYSALPLQLPPHSLHEILVERENKNRNSTVVAEQTNQNCRV